MMLITNWLIYGGLFGTFFLKLTDQKDRDLVRKIAYFLLMCYALYMSVTFFKFSFVYENSKVIKINIYETVFNSLILFLMWTKVKSDNFFNSKK